MNKAAMIYKLPAAIGEVFFQTAGAYVGHNNILMVGYVHRLKGIEEALEAMRIVIEACPAARLLVVGAGTPKYVAELKRHAESGGVAGSVDWLGFKTATEIAALHTQSALLIHPSLLDNSPNSVAEAMASGLPVVASNVGGIPSMIEHNITGLLVAAGNPRELADATIALLHSEPRRRRLAGKAMEVARDRHLPTNVATQTLRVYRDILDKEHKSPGAEPSRQGIRVITQCGRS